MRISDWSSDVCSSDLVSGGRRIAVHQWRDHCSGWRHDGAPCPCAGHVGLEYGSGAAEGIALAALPTQLPCTYFRNGPACPQAEPYPLCSLQQVTTASALSVTYPTLVRSRLLCLLVLAAVASQQPHSSR